MSKQREASESNGPVTADDVAPSEPMEAAKAAMLEAVEQFRETVATPRPVERIEGLAEDETEHVVDLNTATEGELERLPGIGPTLAARIIEHRTTVQRFGEPADVIAVPGISQSLYERLAPRLAASPPGDETSVAPATESAPEEPAEDSVVEAATTIVLDGTAADAGLDGGPSLPEVDESLAEPEEVPVLYPPSERWPERDTGHDIPWPDESDLLESTPEELESDESPLPESGLEAAWSTEAGVPDVTVDVPDLDEATTQEPVPEAAEVEQPKASEPSDKAQERPRTAEPPIVEVVAPSGGCWRLLVVGVLSAIAGAALALLALVLLNRTLDFRTQTNQAVQAEAARMDNQMDILGSELGDVQVQLDAMRGLAGRVEAMDIELQGLLESLEAFQSELVRFGEELGGTQATVGRLTGRTEELGAQVGALEESTERLGAQLGEVTERVGALSEQVEVIRQATLRFEAFLEGLRGLLREVEGPPTPTPWPTALRPIPNTPTPFAVTVVPPATPTP